VQVLERVTLTSSGQFARFTNIFDRALVVTSAKAENIGSVDVMSANRIKAVRASVPSAASDNFVLGQAKSSVPGPIR
jgi:hypothetical protein